MPSCNLTSEPLSCSGSLATPDGTKQPDYIFYRDNEALNTNKGKKLTDMLLQSGAFAVGDAKYWDCPLDTAIRGRGGDPFTNKNPSYQIAFYMQHSGLAWGILTNGRLWRLYHISTAHKLDHFYEVDLPALLTGAEPQDFLYFYAFFRRAAFDAHPLSVAEILRDDIGSLNEEQWKWLVKRRLNRPDLVELTKVFRSRQPAIAAFDTRISNTDRLIDQVVYRLYGLSKDEVATVEARTRWVNGNRVCHESHERRPQGSPLNPASTPASTMTTRRPPKSVHSRGGGREDDGRGPLRSPFSLLSNIALPVIS